MLPSPDGRFLDDEQDLRPAPPEQQRSFARTVVEVCTELFPSAPPARRRMSRGMGVLIQVVAVVIGVAAMLGRIPGIPAWDGMYAEDYWVFLPAARRPCRSRLRATHLRMFSPGPAPLATLQALCRC